MDNKRPMSHQKNVTGKADVHKRGEGLGTGPVGTTNGRRSSGRTGTNKTVTRAGGGGLGVIVIAVLFFVIKGMIGGGSVDVGSLGNYTSDYTGNYSSAPSNQGSSGSTGGLNWQNTSNTGSLDTSVASGTRNKRTQILGNNQDKVTVMVYLCGTDLESRSGMATSDLKEMASANLSDNINLIVYTGGCTRWQNQILNTNVNQIYQIKEGGLLCLEKDMGNKGMTKPATLTEFINYCTKNFPANRNELILWDHGGGSISGYGYDEKNKASGSMTLAGLNEALQNAGTTFDFIGFDACLMATLETALTMEPYADYLVASEETEPGVGWYYTNWLNSLSKNSSLPTIEVGKQIVDDFVDFCGQKCPGQKTTLSIVDLAELKNTVPAELTDFAKSTTDLIKNNGYQKVASARDGAREFAASSKIDQVDLVNLAENMKTTEGKQLADAIKGAVKYNRTSANMTNAYGLAIYFPYKKTSTVKQANSIYKQIGMDDEYSKCISQFAGMEASGQYVSGGQTSPVDVLLGGSSVPSGSAAGNSDLITSLLGSFLGGSGADIFGGFEVDRAATAEYLSENYFDAENLVWINDNGTYKIILPEEQWDMVSMLALSVFIDDGQGYIDLGLDNQFEYDSDGNLIGTYDGTWLAINNNPVAYYVTEVTGDENNYYMTGFVPAMLNDERVEIIIVFDNANPNGYVAGARRVYKDGETDTIAKSMLSIQEGDKIDFICDYYSYDNEYLDSYLLGEEMIVDGDLKVSYVEIGTENVSASYRFTDMYQQNYWTPTVK